jgi:transcription elongation factor Elf1
MAEDTFPKSFHCPKCGSEKTVIGMAIAPLKINGSIPITAFGALEHKLTPLMDPKNAKISCPAISSHFDVCWDCGTYYCTRAELVHLPIPQPGMMQNIGKV